MFKDADKMFESLGYAKISDCSNGVVYSKKTEFDDKEISILYTSTIGIRVVGTFMIGMAELKAINKKIHESKRKYHWR